MQADTLLILGTGGTIAGVQGPDDAPGGYTAGVLGVDELLGGVAPPTGWCVSTQQVASIDSKDMRWSVWQGLAAALGRGLNDATVGGVVITHGTDTLEETACLLDWLHDQRKPIVLTAAMRPATAPDADGPGNLRDAMAVAASLSAAGRGGVWVLMHGRLWPASRVRKAHSHAIDAFDGGGATAAAEFSVADQVWRPNQGGRDRLPVRGPQAALWRWFATQARPRVECVCSHADADGWVVRAMLSCADAAGLRGLVVACTGHGTVHEALAEALEEASSRGVVVWRSTRVARGGVTPRSDGHWPATGGLTVAQARVALSLHLLQAPQRGGSVLAFFDRSGI
jgi:L-asparaginase